MTDRSSPLALTFIILTVALDAIGIGLIFPVMPDLMEEVTHGTLGQAALWGGVLASSFAVMQFVCGPLVGNLSDRYGRRPVLITSLVVMVLDYIVMAVAHTVELLLIARIVAGMASATHSTANAYIADISAPDERAKRFGLVGAAFGIGFVAGPMIGGLVAGIDTRAPFWVAAVMAACNLALGLIVLPESLPLSKRRAFSLRRPRLRRRRRNPLRWLPPTSSTRRSSGRMPSGRMRNTRVRQTMRASTRIRTAPA